MAFSPFKGPRENLKNAIPVVLKRILRCHDNKDTISNNSSQKPLVDLVPQQSILPNFNILTYQN
jgi:hypothetical protein